MNSEGQKESGGVMEKISRTQLMALVWAGVMAPAAESLPALLLPDAGKSAWLSVLLAAPLVLATDWRGRRDWPGRWWSGWGLRRGGRSF